MDSSSVCNSGHTLGRYRAQMHDIDPDYEASCVNRTGLCTMTMRCASPHIVRVVSADHKICHYPMHIVCRVVCRRLPEQSAVNRCGSRIGGSSFQGMGSLGDMQILP